MIITAPFYLLENRYAIIHNATWTYVIDLENCQLHNRIEGIPIAISLDEKFLIISKLDHSLSAEYVLHGVNIRSKESIDVADFRQFDFPAHNKLMFRHFEISYDTPASLILENIFDKNDSLRLTFAEKNSYLVELRIQPQVYRSISTPILAFSGTFDYDADGYGHVWLYDVLGDKKLFDISKLENAPIMFNYLQGASQFTLVACDYVRLVDLESGEATTVMEGKPFDRHTWWQGEPKIIDALGGPTDMTYVLVAERHQWYFVNQTDDGKWIESTHYDVDSPICRISIVNDNVALFTENDFRLLTFEGKSICKIIL